MFKRIDHVEIVTDQLDRTVQFYTEVLEFTVKGRDRIERSGLGVPIDLVYLDLAGCGKIPCLGGVWRAATFSSRFGCREVAS